MSCLHLCCSIQLLIILCCGLVHGATEAGITSQSPLTISPTDDGPVSPTTPGPRATENQETSRTTSRTEASEPTDLTPSGATPENQETSRTTSRTEASEPTDLTPSGATPENQETSRTTSRTEAPEPTDLTPSGATTENQETSRTTSRTEPSSSTQAPSPTTSKPVVTPEVCLCDLTPDFCDIGCCCDTVDCGVADLRTVFTGCPEEAISGACIEKWLMFRANVDPSLVTVTDSLFCVRPEGNTTPPQPLPALPQHPAIGDSYYFSPLASTATVLYARDFYRVDDIILTYFSRSSVRGFLRQPSPGAATTSCVNRNPARFLRSVSQSCSHTLTPQSCTTDPSLNARSYFSDLSLLKLPVAETVPVTDLLIPVFPLSDWLAPRKQNNSCLNVVSKVQFVVGFTGRGELAYARVNVTLTDVALDQVLSQVHSVEFQLATPHPTQGGPIPAVGLRVGSPVIGRFNEDVKPLTVLGVLQGGECSSDPDIRAPILFTHNTITGCTFSSVSRDCSELRSQLYRVLQGWATPDLVAMNSGSQPDWTRVITQQCPVRPQETCQSGCVLPLSLSVQVLWARLGDLDLPQCYILGVRYLFSCRAVRCPVSSSLAVTTEVRFADTTVYPEPPRALPQPGWKSPFGFFSRGTAELDGHSVSDDGTLSKVTWRAVVFAVTMTTASQLFIG
ncbi:tectonic-3-like [Polymixia lowei]